MNENLNLVEILKDCPKGTKLYSIAFGDVKFEEITRGKYYPIRIRVDGNTTEGFSADGKMFNGLGECALFPSKDQRDWSKFTAPWLKKDKFDPKTFEPFDKVLVRDRYIDHWICNLFSKIISDEYLCIGSCYKHCIPYNEETKHLVGTNEEAPEYYKYWED